MCVLLGLGKRFLLLKITINLFVSIEIFQFEMSSKCQKLAVALGAFNLEQINIRKTSNSKESQEKYLAEYSTNASVSLFHVGFSQLCY